MDLPEAYGFSFVAVSTTNEKGEFLCVLCLPRSSGRLVGRNFGGWYWGDLAVNMFILF